MRYSIMLQLVGLITLILLTTAAIFAWLQNRPAAQSSEASILLEIKNEQLYARRRSPKAD